MADRCARLKLLFYNVRSLAKQDRSEPAKCMLEDVEALMKKSRCPVPGEN